MIGIIGAMDVEVNSIKEKVENPVVSNFAGVDFVCGLFEDVMIVVAQCSPGKVNAALCTQLMIDKYQPDSIINIGVACSLSEKVHIKDVVIADDVVEHDMNITALGEPKGFINGLNTIKMATDKKISDDLARIAILTGCKIHRGTVASGDLFIGKEKQKVGIATEFNAICGEMEGAAIGHVCYANKVPFAVMRCVSDGGNEESQIDYPTFKPIAASTSRKILYKYITQQSIQEKIEV